MFADAGGDGHWVWDVLLLLSVPALIVLNGLFVAAEFALVAVRRTRIEELAAKGVKGAKAVQSAINNLDRSIAATQLGITLASIALGFVAEPALARLLEPLFARLPGGWSTVAVHSAAVTLAFLVITFLHVVFGELIPKTFALQSPDSTALWVAKPLNVFAKSTRLLILVMNGTGNAILRFWGYDPATSKSLVHSVEELSLLIEDTEEAGILNAEQAELVQNVFELSNKRVGDCLVSREKMSVIELNTPPDKVLEKVRNTAHTRMPVYEGDVNNVVGIVNTKDLFHLFSLQGVVILQDALYPPLFLKPDEPVANALRLFKKAKRPMAVVRDEAGTVLGLVTLEDILEEIVGDIEDEHDQAPRRIVLRTKRPVQPVRPAVSPTSPERQKGVTPR